jgi:hypothetical protein
MNIMDAYTDFIFWNSLKCKEYQTLYLNFEFNWKTIIRKFRSEYLAHKSLLLNGLNSYFQKKWKKYLCEKVNKYILNKIDKYLLIDFKYTSSEKIAYNDDTFFADEYMNFEYYLLILEIEAMFFRKYPHHPSHTKIISKKFDLDKIVDTNKLKKELLFIAKSILQFGISYHVLIRKLYCSDKNLLIDDSLSSEEEEEDKHEYDNNAHIFVKF